MTASVRHAAANTGGNALPDEPARTHAPVAHHPVRAATSARMPRAPALLSVRRAPARASLWRLIRGALLERESVRRMGVTTSMTARSLLLPLRCSLRGPLHRRANPEPVGATEQETS